MPAETIPILPSADFDVSASFWSGFGFVEDGRWPDYLVLRHSGSRDRAALPDQPGRGPLDERRRLLHPVRDPDEAVACHAAWADVAVPEPASFSMPRSEPWGAVEFHIIDLHGNLVRLGGFPPAEQS